MTEQEVEGNVFTQEGRLSQAEFAIKNVNEAGTIMGLVCTNGVVLVGVNAQKSARTEKIYKVNENVCVAVSGVFSDALRLLKFVRVTSAGIEEEIGRCPKTSVLCDLISQEKQKHTQMAGTRPFGVAFLYSGYEDDEFVLYSTDPSGTINRWTACCIGADSDTINSALRNDVSKAQYNLEDGVRGLLEIYVKTKEWSEDLSERLEILKFTGGENRMLEMNEIQQIIQSVQRV